MRILKVASLFFASPFLLFGALSAPLYAEDLTLPPEFRGVAPRADEAAPQKAAPLEGKNKKNKAVSSKSVSSKLPTTPMKTNSPAADEAVVSSAKSQEDPLSFGMKWKADNQPSTGGPNTSGMFTDYNRNIEGQSAGSGAEVGVKYKF